MTIPGYTSAAGSLQLMVNRLVYSRNGTSLRPKSRSHHWKVVKEEYQRLQLTPWYWNAANDNVSGSYRYGLGFLKDS